MNLDRVATLISSGLKATEVATIVGCSPARISQLISSDESFQLMLKGKEAEVMKEDAEDEALSLKYTAMEHQLLKQMSESLLNAELRDVTSALRVVAERQEKMKARTLLAKNPGLLGSGNNNTYNVVSISLPSHALPQPKMVMNSQMEVIAIGEQSLAPMGSQAVTDLFKRMQQTEQTERGEYHEPSSSDPKSEADVVEVTSEQEGFLKYARS